MGFFSDPFRAFTPIPLKAASLVGGFADNALHLDALHDTGVTKPMRSAARAVGEVGQGTFKVLKHGPTHLKAITENAQAITSRLSLTGENGHLIGPLAAASGGAAAVGAAAVTGLDATLNGARELEDLVFPWSEAPDRLEESELHGKTKLGRLAHQFVAGDIEKDLPDDMDVARASQRVQNPFGEVARVVLN